MPVGGHSGAGGVQEALVSALRGVPVDVRYWSQRSEGFVDANGNGLRYQNVIYSNAYHGMGVYPKPGAGGGFPAGGQGGQGAPNANQNQGAGR